MGDVAGLPADETDLETSYSGQQVTDVSTDDGVRVQQCATDEYTVHLFKEQNVNNTDEISITVNLRSDLAPSSSTVYLQVYNFTDNEWEAVDNDSTTGADTDFDLEGEITVDVGEYYDGGNYVAFRVYQLAV